VSSHAVPPSREEMPGPAPAPFDDEADLEPELVEGCRPSAPWLRATHLGGRRRTADASLERRAKGRRPLTITPSSCGFPSAPRSPKPSDFSSSRHSRSQRETSSAPHGFSALAAAGSTRSSLLRRARSSRRGGPSVSRATCPTA
jgi:hypothetical protein